MGHATIKCPACGKFTRRTAHSPAFEPEAEQRECDCGWVAEVEVPQPEERARVRRAINSPLHLQRCKCGHLRFMHDSFGSRPCTVTPVERELAVALGVDTSPHPCNCAMYQHDGVSP
jgi:hypothetical protein